jgi:hypothetical protein
MRKSAAEEPIFQPSDSCKSELAFAHRAKHSFLSMIVFGFALRP